eukprot:5932225-Pyramimonas_sp.AAC.1
MPKNIIYLFKRYNTPLCAPASSFPYQTTLLSSSCSVTPSGHLTGGSTRAGELALGGKERARQWVRRGRAEPFAASVFPPGHRGTDTAKWLTSGVPFEATHEDGYEPYVVVTTTS